MKRNIDRKQAEFLWELLDDIDTASDAFKPNDLRSYDRYFSYIQGKLRKRFKVFESDGYNLFTKEEWEEHGKSIREKMHEALRLPNR